LLDCSVLILSIAIFLRAFYLSKKIPRLKLSDHTDSSDAPVELVELQSRRHTKIRVPRRCNEAQAGEKDTALASLQRQILLFLAQLDSPTCMTVVKVEETQIAEEAISWSTKKVLKFDLPFAEMKPSIYLGLVLMENACCFMYNLFD
jgi:hypothetical protein